MEVLFYKIRLVASPEQVWLARKTDLSMIKRYVKAIVMVPMKPPWLMTKDIQRHYPGRSVRYVVLWNEYEDPYCNGVGCRLSWQDKVG